MPAAGIWNQEGAQACGDFARFLVLNCDDGRLCPSVFRTWKHGVEFDLFRCKDNKNKNNSGAQGTVTFRCARGPSSALGM